MYVSYLHVTFICVLFALFLYVCIYMYMYYVNSCDPCTYITAFTARKNVDKKFVDLVLCIESSFSYFQ